MLGASKEGDFSVDFGVKFVKHPLVNSGQDMTESF